jgi:hypothetical protein
MSNKKRRNRQQSSFKKIDLDSSESTINQASAFESTVQPNQSGETNETRWLVYLKSHWWMIGLIAFLSVGVLGAGLKYLDEDAKLEIARRANKGQFADNEEQSLLSRINPFVPAAMPNPTPQLSKEYIYAGSKVTAVEDANANAAPPADLAVWRPSTGTWWVMGGTGSQQTSQAWGIEGDIPRQGDFDGDGKTDFCVFRKNTSAHTATWYIVFSSSGATTQIQFGLDTDIPSSADFDGDGKTDISVFRDGVWYINQSTTNNTVWASFGTAGDEPLPADFDGDGKADIAVRRSGNNTFYSSNSTNGQTLTTNFGAAGDKATCGDYDGDGRADISVWRPSSHTWYYKKSSDGGTISYPWGIGTDLPVQNDYDGDGKVDMALWRAVDSGANDVGKWFIYQSSTSTIRQEQWGITRDIPVAAYYRR